MSRDLPSYSKLAEAIGTLCKLTILEHFFAGINIYISIRSELATSRLFIHFLAQT